MLLFLCVLLTEQRHPNLVPLLVTKIGNQSAIGRFANAADLCNHSVRDRRAFAMNQRNRHRVESAVKHAHGAS